MSSYTFFSIVGIDSGSKFQTVNLNHYVNITISYSLLVKWGACENIKVIGDASIWFTYLKFRSNHFSVGSAFEVYLRLQKQSDFVRVADSTFDLTVLLVRFWGPYVLHDWYAPLPYLSTLVTCKNTYYSGRVNAVKLESWISENGPTSSFGPSKRNSKPT